MKHGINLQVVREDLVGAELKLKGIPEVCEVVFIAYVRPYFSTVSLNPVLRGIKQMPTRTKKTSKKCSVVKKVPKVNICSPLPWKVIMFISILKVLLNLAIKQGV